MRLRFRVLATLLAAIASLTAFTPAASAEPAGNCPETQFCLWDVWVNPGGEDARPTLVTDTDWTGDATAFRVYNGTRRYALVEYQETLPDGSVRKYTDGCFVGPWGYFTRHFTVTKVTFHKTRPVSYCS
ncbi:hypothetical protein [Saccharothrix coeruleofusca]|uniref:Peptidase inhibitor family I36 n=1 Tax=Saccharothrix coeruleofusca TaxID=33919 RepID=A0A918AJV3_9PSEU|nr:hypothetical protein [Saccharothrix coeruleofusca]MBP2338505.1 hypothetical protein [Saccharothrix coeruleofusca]GGP47945.1 hypothetical protein GCM10010185_19780 [Saccharothrix coeruleofusca]